MDRDELMQEVLAYGLEALEYADEEILADKEFVLKIIEEYDGNYEDVLEYVSVDLRSDKEFIKRIEYLTSKDKIGILIDGEEGRLNTADNTIDDVKKTLDVLNESHLGRLLKNGGKRYGIDDTKLKQKPKKLQDAEKEEPKESEWTLEKDLELIRRRKKRRLELAIGYYSHLSSCANGVAQQKEKNDERTTEIQKALSGLEALDSTEEEVDRLTEQLKAKKEQKNEQTAEKGKGE